MTIIIATDGSCLKNPGPGGWSYTDGTWTRYGGEPNTTNNRMELVAVLAAITDTQKHDNIHILSDSKYVIQSLFGENGPAWAAKWEKNNWLTSKKKPIENQDLIMKTWKLLETRKTNGDTITIEWVKGHSGHKMNETADLFANWAAHQIKAGKKLKVEHTKKARPTTI